MNRPPTELDDWMFFKGRIEGQLKTGKRIITSTIVEINEDVVMTKSRNPYRLKTCAIPAGHLMDIFSTSDPLEAVRIMIERNKT